MKIFKIIGLLLCYFLPHTVFSSVDQHKKQDMIADFYFWQQINFLNMEVNFTTEVNEELGCLYPSSYMSRWLWENRRTFFYWQVHKALQSGVLDFAFVNWYGPNFIIEMCDFLKKIISVNKGKIVKVNLAWSNPFFALSILNCFENEKIEWLSVRGTGLNYLPNFYYSSQYLKMLDISWNANFKISTGLNLFNLESLNMAGCKSIDFSSFSIINLSSIKSINISWNDENSSLYDQYYIENNNRVYYLKKIFNLALLPNIKQILLFSDFEQVLPSSFWPKKSANNSVNFFLGDNRKPFIFNFINDCTK